MTHKNSSDRTMSHPHGPTIEGESTCWYDLNTGMKCWKNSKGQLHRIHGPAIEKTNGTQEYWIHGILVHSDFVARIMKQRFTNRKFVGG